MCPPVPPAAISSSGAVIARPQRSRSAASCGRLRVSASSAPMTTRGRQHGRAAIGDEGQRHALGRQQPDGDRDVDEGLQPEQHRQPRAGESHERLALVDQPGERAQRDEEVEADDAERQQQAEFLGATAMMKSVCASGSAHFTWPCAAPTPKKPPSLIADWA